jgi:hypothetical protein
MLIPVSFCAGTRLVALALSSQDEAGAKGSKMLGRHVYRVHASDGRWSVTKEGEDQPREFVGRDAALAEARRLADADQPSRVVVDNGDGILLEEELFGSDLSQELDPLA